MWCITFIIFKMRPVLEFAFRNCVINLNILCVRVKLLILLNCYLIVVDVFLVFFFFQEPNYFLLKQRFVS